jgi:tetratricopeptide (TPR) repeat protein
MSDENRQDLYEKSTIRDQKIKISTTNPELKNKIHYDIANADDKVNWYIKFNIALDPLSVNKKTMNITETNGYILNAIIEYDTEKNMIVLSPVDIYLQNEYYLLNITRKVRSEKGQRLKREIHIMFKLMDNQITEFQLLKSTVKVAKPRPRTKQYQKELAKKISVTKVYSFDESIFESVPRHQLPYDNMSINFLIGLLGIVITLASFAVQLVLLTFIGLGVCLLGIGHILFQFRDRQRRSAVNYNMGVLFFNIAKYRMAQKKFRKALTLSEDNEMAEYGLSKTQFYL